jgi:hypothetical protein
LTPDRPGCYTTKPLGRLTQRESDSFTRNKSGVQSPQRPPKKRPVAILKVFREAEEDTRTYRLQCWCYEIANGEDPEQLSERIAGALAGEEGDIVRAAVLESARAAIDAVDTAVIPSIGRLTNRFLTTKTPELRVFRNVIAMLKGLDGETLGLLQGIVLRLNQIDIQGDITTSFLFDKGPEFNCWNWYVVVRNIGPTPETVPLATGDAAYRLATALLGESHSPFGTEAELPAPRFSVEMRELLAAIL